MRIATSIDSPEDADSPYLTLISSVNIVDSSDVAAPWSALDQYIIDSNLDDEGIHDVSNSTAGMFLGAAALRSKVTD